MSPVLPKAPVALSLLLFLISLGLAKEPFVEGAGPAHPRAGRVLALTRSLRITDRAGPFLFHQPLQLAATRDGTIFLQEGAVSLLMFDQQGAFLGNPLRKGQGPGEILQMSGFLVRENDIVLFDEMQDKLVRLDHAGAFLEEIRLQSQFVGILAASGDDVFLSGSVRPTDRREGIKELLRPLARVTHLGETKATPFSFPVSYRVVHVGRSVQSTPLARLLTAWDGSFLYLSHTPEYSVVLVDLATEKKVRRILRTYPRVPYHDPEGSIDEELFYNDIQRLLIHNGRLWVLTSTYRQGKGVLVDVFNPEGSYLDRFFLPLTHFEPDNERLPRPMAVVGDLLYVVEWNPAEEIFISRYAIEKSP